jgi:glycosyltransferase 2 family protein
MSKHIWNQSLLLTATAVVIISGISFWLTWRTSADLIQRISLFALVPILSAALAGFSLRILRFHYFLIQNGVAISVRDTAIVQAVGFALSVTPGNIGEVIKLYLIRERAGTPMAKTAPFLLLDRFTEGGAFIILASASALAMPALLAQFPNPSLRLLVLGLVLGILLLARGVLNRKLLDQARLARSRPLRRFLPFLQTLWQGLESSFTVSQVMGGLVLSALGCLADGLVVVFAAHVLGFSLALPAAIIVLGVSGLAGGISLLPAGTGAVETTMIGLLALHGATLPEAVSITLVTRLLNLWLWVGLGLSLAFALRFSSGRSAHDLERQCPIQSSSQTLDSDQSDPFTSKTPKAVYYLLSPSHVRKE